MFWIRKVASMAFLMSFLLSNPIIICQVSGFSSPASLKHGVFSPRLYSPTSSSSRLVMPKRTTTLKMSVAVEGKENSEPLFEKVGEGIRRDMKARLPFFKSDIKDGLNAQVSQTMKEGIKMIIISLF